MQAVQSIGSSRVQRFGVKRNYLLESVAKKLAIPALLIFAFIFTVFIPTGADSTDDIVMSVGTSTSTSQSAAHMLYVTAVTEKDHNDGYVGNDTKEAWEVTGSGNDMLDRALSAYNYIAYYMDPALDYIYNDLTYATPMLDREGADFSAIDRRILAAGFVACFKNEIGGCTNGVDVVENWNELSSLRQEWTAMSYDQKIAALKDDNWLDDNGYALTSTQAGGDWGYGIIQFTGGRRINLATFGEQEGIDITQLQGQMLYVLVEWYCKINSTTVPYFQNTLLGKPFTADSCALACDLIYSYTVYSGSGYPAASFREDRHSNINTADWYGTGMTMFEALQAFDAEGVSAFTK